MMQINIKDLPRVLADWLRAGVAVMALALVALGLADQLIGLPRFAISHVTLAYLAGAAALVCGWCRP